MSKSWKFLLELLSHKRNALNISRTCAWNFFDIDFQSHFKSSYHDRLNEWSQNWSGCKGCKKNLNNPQIGRWFSTKASHDFFWVFWFYLRWIFFFCVRWKKKHQSWFWIKLSIIYIKEYWVMDVKTSCVGWNWHRWNNWIISICRYVTKSCFCQNLLVSNVCFHYCHCKTEKTVGRSSRKFRKFCCLSKKVFF